MQEPVITLSTSGLCPLCVLKKSLRRGIQKPESWEWPWSLLSPTPGTLAGARDGLPGAVQHHRRLMSLRKPQAGLLQLLLEKSSLFGGLGSASPAGPLPSLCGVRGTCGVGRGTGAHVEAPQQSDRGQSTWTQTQQGCQGGGGLASTFAETEGVRPPAESEKGKASWRFGDTRKV